MNVLFGRQWTSVCYRSLIHRVKSFPSSSPVFFTQIHSFPSSVSMSSSVHPIPSTTNSSHSSTPTAITSAPVSPPTFTYVEPFLPPPPSFPLHTCLTFPSSSTSPHQVFIVGDVHGCFDELLRLVELSQIDLSRDTLILAGDLVGKGPKSVDVVQWCVRQRREKKNVYAVIGNHDQFLLRCAYAQGKLDGKQYRDALPADRPTIMAAERAETSTPSAAAQLPWIEDWTHDTAKSMSEHNPSLYALTYYARMTGFHSVTRSTADHWITASRLTDEEMHFIATLPLSIELKGLSTRVVHAGLVPDRSLEHQHPFHCMTMRNLVKVTQTQLTDATPDKKEVWLPFETQKVGLPWSTVWKEQEMLIFGHDAVRGFQRPSSSVLGLDTGACYGKYLTGVWLPAGDILHVRSDKVYSKPGSSEDTSNPPPTPIPFKVESYNTETDPMNAWDRTNHPHTPSPLVVVDTSSSSSKL